VRRAIEPLTGELLREAARRFRSAALDEAWGEFRLWRDDEPFESDSAFAQVFISWFLHDWTPGRRDADLPAAHAAPTAEKTTERTVEQSAEKAAERTAAQSYLARAGHRLDPIARAYVEACCAAPFSMYEVIDCRPGVGFRLRDVLVGSEVDVIEHSGSLYARAGDLLFAKVVPIEGMHLIEALGPTPLPPVDKAQLIALRRKMGSMGDLFGAELLRDHAADLRAFYLEAAERLPKPRLPELRNTDGDPLELHTLIYDLDSPPDAFEALRDLGAGFVEPALERDAGGRMVRAEITWSRAGNKVHRHWDNTTLGVLRIEGTRLTAEVNSAKRAADLRALIEQRLGATARARPGVVQSAQAALGRTLTPQERQRRFEREQEQAELAARPEVQEALRHAMRQHYRAWVDDRLPILGNRSPRQAIRDADGREAVAALLDQIERDGARMKPPRDPEIVRELR
jgi:hypothetical protein